MDVSVLVPTYNRPDALVRAVKSVLDQSRQPEEVVVVDDASDRSYEEAQSKLRSLSEGTNTVVRYHRMDTNGGACRARNEAARRAEGSILMFLDDDDGWESQKIKNQLEIFSERSNVGLVYSGRKVVDEKGSLLYKISPNHNGWLDRKMLIKNLIGTTSGVAIRANVFNEVGGFDPSMPALQDYDLWIRVSRKMPIEYDEKYTVRWRVSKQSKEQMARNPSIYHDALRLIGEKYRPEFESLSTIEYRRSMSWRYSVLANKYRNVGSLWQYYYAIRGVLKYPTISSISNLLPYKMYYLIRGILTS
jgi:glycosyltransferase involved in cell wall biosynthesis